MNIENLIERSRSLISEQPDSAVISREKLTALVPVALSLLQESIRADRAKLDSFKQDVSAVITNGVADLTGVVETNGLRLDMVDGSDVRVVYDGNPSLKTVQFVHSLDRLTLGGIQDYLFILAYIAGAKIYFRNNAEAADQTTNLTETVTIRGVCLPDSIEKIPQFLEGELAQILAKLAIAEIPAPPPQA